MFGGLFMNKFMTSILTLIGCLSIFLSPWKTENKKTEFIYYDNVDYTENIDFYGINGQNINYTATLSNPGDYYEIAFDIKNASQTDVHIESFIIPNNDEYISYELNYINGENIKVGDSLKGGEKVRVKFTVKYNKQIQEKEYSFDSSFQIRYEQNL